MPSKPEGVYRDGRGGWYVKLSLGTDPLTKRRVQLTRRGFRSASEAARGRRELLGEVDSGTLRPTSGTLNVDELLDLYLDGLDAGKRLSEKTRFDYRHYSDSYVRPLLGHHRVRDVTADTIVRWQRELAAHGGTKNRKPLAANTIRLARSPLAGAFKLAVSMGMIATSPLGAIPRPAVPRSVPGHWSPEEAREFLSMMEGDRTYPIWAFLLGSGLRIGELVCLRWPNVDLAGRSVRVVEFVSTLGWDVTPSTGKSRDAVRTIDLDDGLIDVLELQASLQEDERLIKPDHQVGDNVFTRSGGGPYHPQVLSRMLGRLTVEAGLPRLTAHGLRHTSATLMLAAGVPPKVAAERLGHSDPTLFKNLYSHVTPTMQREAAERIGAILFAEDSSDRSRPRLGRAQTPSARSPRVGAMDPSKSSSDVRAAPLLSRAYAGTSKSRKE